MTTTRKRTRPTAPVSGHPLVPPFAPRPPSRTPFLDLVLLSAQIRKRKAVQRRQRAAIAGAASGHVRAGKSKRQAINAEAARLRARGFKKHNIAAAVARKLRVTPRYVRDVLKGK
jgi:hypothetical protein